DFGSEDVKGRLGTVVIDELAAQQFFPGVDPIGKQIDDPVTIGLPAANGVHLTIIGIVPRTRNKAPGEKEEAPNLLMMYFREAQCAKEEEDLIIRGKAGFNPHSLIGPIRNEIAALDRDQAVSDISTIEENIDDSLASQRLTMTLLGVFAGLALILASIGL